MSVDISIGTALMNKSDSTYGWAAWQDAVTNLTISAADPSNPRIDAVVAYIDLSVISTVSNNNPGALKFSDVTGTPAGSPTAPSDSAVTSALGAGVPWIRLANVTVGAGATQVVTANIADVRPPFAVHARLWGGSSNTYGHTVPNAADDTVQLLAAAQSPTNKSFDNTSTFTGIKLRSMSGWVDANETWTYSSYDSTNKTGVLTVPSDATLKYSKGMRVTFTNNSATQYGIVTGVTSTTLTIYFGTDYSLTNSAITANYYSSQKAPFGFPLDPLKWAVTLTDTNNRITAGTSGTWINPGSLGITVPNGSWELGYKATCEGLCTTSAQLTPHIALSTSSSSVSDPDFEFAMNTVSTTQAILWPVFYRKAVTVTSATPYYLIVQPSGSGTTSAGTRGDLAETVIKAVCAFL